MEGTPIPEEGEWRAKTLARLAARASWPYWPVLPMKRRRLMEDGSRTVDAAGYSLLADCDTVIVRGFPRDAGPKGPYWAALAAAEAEGESDWVIARYESVEAMLDDGWTVD